MDNAVKALIIAGAVLIAILLIGVGIMVFNAANDPLNQAQSSSEQQAVQMFNEPFMANLGDADSGGITGQQAKSLISTIQASNGKNDKKITFSGSISKVSQISTKYRYSAVETYDDDGYINTVTITKIEKSST